MNKLAKTIMTMIVAVLATTFTVTEVEAKEYKAKEESMNYRIWVSDDFKNGIATYYNGGEFYLESKKDYTVLYNVKTGTTKVSSVKAPTMKSKKIKSEKGKTLKIKKDSVVKFKVIQGKVTKAKVKKTKTYYVVCKVQKTNFTNTAAGSFSKDYNKKATIKINEKACDKIIYSVNGKKTKKTFDSWENVDFSFTINKPTTITVTGYKLGKKLGTYTYKYDVKKYTPNKMHDYKLKGEFPSQDYCHYAFYLPYGDGFVFSYTLDGSTPTLTNGTLVESVTDKDLDYYKRGYEVKSPVDGNVTLKVQYYKKAYIKEGNKYVFDSYQPYGNVLGGRYVGITATGIGSVLSDGNLCATESYKDTYNFHDYQCTKNLDYALVTWLDNKGYVRTQKLMPGERISEYSDWGALELVEIVAVKDGKPSNNYKNLEVYEAFRFPFRDEFLTFDLLLDSYEVYEKGLPETEFPRLTPDQTYADSDQGHAGKGICWNGEWLVD